MRRQLLAMFVLCSMLLAGCFGSGESVVGEDTQPRSMWEDYTLIDEQGHETPKDFMTLDLQTNKSTNMTWAVFDASKGGNCCEHYLATSIDGSI
ncbi:hypothetical protein N9V76_04680, partial [Candidatus Poseidoniales archaeon]|nr:hypothetical protein [Candidatus Poseidoniales archaeon]